MASVDKLVSDDEVTSKLLTSLCDFLNKVSNMKGNISDESSCVVSAVLLMKDMLQSSQNNRWVVANQSGLVDLMKLSRKATSKAVRLKISIWHCIKALLGDDWNQEKEIVNTETKLLENGLSPPNILLKQLVFIKTALRQDRRNYKHNCSVRLNYDQLLDDSEESDGNPDALSAELVPTVEEETNEIYMKGRSLDICSDLTHEIRPNEFVKEISGITIVKIVSSMFNSGKGGCIYFGVTESRIIKGMRLTRELRDGFRVSIDETLRKSIDFTISHDMYNIQFCPVVYDKNLIYGPIKPDHVQYIIKLIIKPCSGLYFLRDGNCYWRIGDMTHLASAQQIRDKAALIEQEVCLAEIDRLKKEISYYS